MRRLTVVEVSTSVSVIELYHCCFYIKLYFKFQKVVCDPICKWTPLLVLDIHYFYSNWSDISEMLLLSYKFW